MMVNKLNKVLVIDFGSQYCKLIARKIREIGVYSEIKFANDPKLLQNIQEYQAIIFSGGPDSVYKKESLKINLKIFEFKIPILGVCYGMQIIHYLLGGKIEKLKIGEYGKTKLSITNQNNVLVKNIKSSSTVWMSHFDTVTKLAPGFKLIGKTLTCKAIAINQNKKIYTLQFHPEVSHTNQGKLFLENFLFNIAKLKPSWKPIDIVNQKINEAKNEIKQKKVILGVSGGIDSTVVALLLHKAINKNLIPIFINNGLLRKNEVQEVQNNFRKLKIKIITIDASKVFYKVLKNVESPERKRKIIGKTFVQEFSKIQKKYPEADFLAQGTIYPDVIESSKHNPKNVIKSHHNVGGLPKKMNLKVYEPLKNLFKDEVKKIGKKLGITNEILNRHPFPGPGLAIRIIGDITDKKIKILQKVDNIFINELKKANYYSQVSQAIAILTPLKTVGVQGDQRSYKYLVALRVVNTVDFMTARFSHLNFDFLEKVSNAIINQVKEVNRVVYDITSKPPGTIEWE